MVAQRQLDDTVLIVVKYWFESDSISNNFMKTELIVQILMFLLYFLSIKI